jgi:hypothetical protein
MNSYKSFEIINEVFSKSLMSSIDWLNVMNLNIFYNVGSSVCLKLRNANLLFI